ncbi:uncharacterized protein YndB with AHSA1/START domain [Nakamurella sp. UYEF19]|uniref:SRPBCC domain-containing protein n=1 Tax=Nakamurella sp. UYEF19 TaxID=1756392 RepID=UPI00339ADA95
MTDQIERNILVQAPLPRVWDMVTEPGWWVPSEVPAPAYRSIGAVTVRSSDKWGRFPVEVIAIDPMTYVAFRWASQFPGRDLTNGISTLIEFHLEEAPDGVRVSVVESGFDALDSPEDVRQAGFSDNSEGWESELRSLAGRAAIAPERVSAR